MAGDTKADTPRETGLVGRALESAQGLPPQHAGPGLAGAVVGLGGGHSPLVAKQWAPGQGPAQAGQCPAEGPGGLGLNLALGVLVIDVAANSSGVHPCGERGKGGRGGVEEGRLRIPDPPGHTHPWVRKVFRSRACGSRAGRRARDEMGAGVRSEGNGVHTPHSPWWLPPGLPEPSSSQSLGQVVSPWGSWRGGQRRHATPRHATQHCAHASHEAGHQGATPTARHPPPPPPVPAAARPAPNRPASAPLTSACPPGVSVFPQRSQRRHGRCQSLPRDVTFSAGDGRGGEVGAPPGGDLPGWGWARPLTKVDPLVAARTHVGFPGERGDAGGWEGEESGRGTAAPTPRPPAPGNSAQPTFAGPLRGSAGLPLLSSGHGDLDGASDLRFLGRGLLVDVGAGTSDIHPCEMVGTVGGWPVGSPTTQPSQPPPNFSEKGPPRPTVESGPPPRGHPWAADFRERHGGCWSFKDGRGQHGEGDKGAGGIQGSTASRQASPKSLLGRGSALAMSPSAGADHTPWRPTQAHLWVRTTWHSRACGRRASRHARQRAGREGGDLAWAPRPPLPARGRGSPRRGPLASASCCSART